MEDGERWKMERCMEFAVNKAASVFAAASHSSRMRNRLVWLVRWCGWYISRVSTHVYILTCSHTRAPAGPITGVDS